MYFNVTFNNYLLSVYILHAFFVSLCIMHANYLHELQAAI